MSPRLNKLNRKVTKLRTEYLEEVAQSAGLMIEDPSKAKQGGMWTTVSWLPGTLDFTIPIQYVPMPHVTAYPGSEQFEAYETTEMNKTISLLLELLRAEGLRCSLDGKIVLVSF